MADSTTATFFCAVRNATGGDRDVKVTWTLPTPILFEADVALTQNATTAITGYNTGSLFIIVVPPTENTQQIRIDDAAGKKVSKSIPFIVGVEFDATLTLHLAAGQNQVVHVIVI